MGTTFTEDELLKRSSSGILTPMRDGDVMQEHCAATSIVAASDSLHPERADYNDLRTAIDALPAVGGEIALMEGTHLPSQQVDLVDNLKLSGCGAGTVLKFDGSAAHGLYGVGVSNVEISHLCIDDVLGMGGSGYRGLIDFESSSSECSVHDVYIKNATGLVVGILVDDCQRMRCHDNILDTCCRSVRFCKSDYCKIFGNSFIDIGPGGGLGLCCARYMEVSGNIFDGSTSEDYRSDIWIGGFYRASYDLNIHHNILNTTRGIRFIGDGGNGHALDRVNVENNIIITTGDAISNPEMGYHPSTSVLSDIVIKDNIISGAAKGIHFDNYGTMDFTIRDNVFTGCTTEIDIEAGITTDIWRNKGYVTENSGTATLLAAGTSVDVPHGLAVTPVAGDIIVTPMEAWGNMTTYYIGNYGATNFTIYSPIAPGQDVDFAWKAIVL